MKLFAATSALALAAMSTPATAQMNMPGMKTPMPAKPVAKEAAPTKRDTSKNPAARKKTSPKKKPAKGASAGQAKRVPTSATSTSAEGMAMPPMEHMDHSQMGHVPVAQGQMQMGEHGGHTMNMTGAFGSYPM